MKQRHKPMKTLLMTGASAAVLASATAVANAQDDETILEEIVVTAQKRSERVQDVPIAMSAYDAKFVERTNLDDVKDLIKFSPGFAGDSKDSFIDYVNVRGISTNDFGIGGDPSIGFFKNGLYQGRQGTAVSSLYDLERAEVLRGPQGFLFGRNAISGAISFHTAKPDFESTSGYVEFGFGDRGILEGEAALNLPVTENFALRFAAYTSHENGWISNSYMPNADKLAGHDKTAGRITAAARGDFWDATFIAEYEDRDTSGTVYRALADEDVTPVLTDTFGGSIMPRSPKRSISSDMTLGNYDRGEILSLSSEINIDLESMSITSITGYKDHTYEYAEDYDGMSLGLNDYSQDQKGDYFEQELRVTSKSDSNLSWYAGASYYKENIKSTFVNRADEDAMCGAYYYYYDNCAELYDYWGYPGFETTSVGLSEANKVRGSYSGWGAYVDLKYDVTDKFDVGFGLRYTKDTKDFSIWVKPVESELGPWYIFGLTTAGYVNEKRSWDDFTPRFTARYRASDDLMVYTSVSKGYKSGGFASFGVTLSEDGVGDNLVARPGATPDHFNPETVWSYELGIKGNSPDKRIRYDLNAYHYSYQDLQLSYFDSGELVDNIGSVKAYGAEASIQSILTDNFDLLLSGSFNSNKINGAEDIEPGSDGNRLTGTPKYKASGLLSFHKPMFDRGEVTASLEFTAQSSTFIGLSNLATEQISGWHDISVRVGYADDAGWAITAFVENLTNEIYFDGGNSASGVQPATVFGASRPRTYGLNFSYKFGD